MGVQLNIKDAETVRLARELAEITGQPITQAIKSALRRELRENEFAIAVKRAELKAILSGTRAMWDADKLEGDPTDFLYDDRGMPA
jgi:antitoxin VapB